MGKTIKLLAFFSVLALLWGLERGCPAQLRGGGTISLAEGERWAGNAMVTGETVRISGIIEGDLLCLARGLTIAGNVRQDLWGIAEDIDLVGRVGDDLRGVGRRITVIGVVGGDLLAGCQNFSLPQGGVVEGEVRAGCKEAELNGTIKGDAHISAQTIRIGGRIEGDVHLEAKKIILSPSAFIKGKLNYKSPLEIEVPEGAKILGGSQWERPKVKKKDRSVISIFLEIVLFLGLLLVGIIAVSLSQRNAILVSGTLTSSPWKSLGWGLIALICLPIAIFILLLTVIGLPLAVFLLFGYILALYLSKVFVGVFIGGKILGIFFKKGLSPIWYLILGLIILTLLAKVPYLGWPVRILTIIFGLGSLLLSRRALYLQAKAKELI